MLALSSSGRSQTLRAGIICLIFGAGMFIAHLVHNSSEPKRFANSNPASIVTPPLGENQNWASPKKHKKVSDNTAPPVRTDHPAPAPVVKAAPSAAEWFVVSSTDVLRAQGNVTLVPTQISTAGDSTRIKLAVDSRILAFVSEIAFPMDVQPIG